MATDIDAPEGARVAAAGTAAAARGASGKRPAAEVEGVVATLLGHAVEKAREEERDRAGRESQRRKREFGDQHAAFLLARVRALLEEMETRPEYGSSEEAARGLAGWTLESIYNAFEESVPRLSGPWRSQTACHAAGLALFGPEICGARFDEDADQNLDVTFHTLLFMRERSSLYPSPGIREAPIRAILSAATFE